MLASGSSLGRYQIVGLLGAGGMGEVYRARDPQLGRDVAIKRLPAEVANDRNRLSRFENEARAASALNHPNIVTIHEIGQAADGSFIVMELVEGKTLRELLGPGPLRERRVVQIAAQAASGLAKAHAAGIVHRDLKPENLMVTSDGVAKILDFGLAKLVRPIEEGEGSQAPTRTQATKPGVILGTVAYMSPEQALGKPLDFRSDQFSLGAVLYEMATGTSAFRAPTAELTVAAILEKEPTPVGALNPRIPIPLRWIIERCLAKDPEERYSSTSDLAKDLAALRDRISDVESTSHAEARHATGAQGRVRILAAGLASVLLVAGLVAWRLRQTDYFWQNPLAGSRFTRVTDWAGSEVDAAVSHDGKFVTFLADRDGSFDVWVGQLGGGGFLNLTKGRYPDLENPVLRNTGFSGDGSQVCFPSSPQGGREQGTLVVPTMGGAPRPLLVSGFETVWSPDGMRLLYHTTEPGDPIFVADRNGGNARRVFVERPGIHNHFPAWSADGRFVYFVRGVPPNDMDIWRIPSSGGVPERLTAHRSRVAYPTALDGRTLLYLAAREDGSGSGLFALDVERRVPHAVSFGLEEYLSLAASADGKRLVAAIANPPRNLWTVPLQDHVVDEASVERFDLPSLRAGSPRFGPGYVAYLSSKRGADGLWKSENGLETELWKGADGPVLTAPAISPDGAWIAFVVRSGVQGQLHVIGANGTGVRRVADALDVRDASWSPDGRWIAVAVTEGGAHPLYKVPLAGGPPVLLLDGREAVIADPVWSPDGSFIVYSEGQGSGQMRIRGVRPDGTPFALPEIWVALTGNRYRFLPDGTGLVIMQGVFSRQNFSLLDLRAGTLRPLTNLQPGFEMRTFDVSPDGKRILFDRFRRNADVVLIELAR